jgi:hypothetical protein
VLKSKTPLRILSNTMSKQELPNSATPITPIQDNLKNALDALITWLQGKKFKVAKKDEDVRVPEDDIPEGILRPLVKEMGLTRKVRQRP